MENFLRFSSAHPRQHNTAKYPPQHGIEYLSLIQNLNTPTTIHATRGDLAKFASDIFESKFFPQEEINI